MKHPREYLIKRGGDPSPYLIGPADKAATSWVWTHCQRCAKRYTRAEAHATAHLKGQTLRVVRLLPRKRVQS